MALINEDSGILSVSQLNRYIENLLAQDDVLSNLWVKGEISGLKLYQQSGHMYFNLKDQYSLINCVMYRSRVQKLRFKPEDGMEVFIRGNVSVYEKQGRYQLYAEEMQLSGLGQLYKYLEELKQKMEKRGYFAQEKKKALPILARKVGIVTSQDGAALRDILRILTERCPGVQIIYAHSSVQGAEAPGEIAAAIKLLNEYGDLDLIIVGRGGGSMEDLMAFNSEEVVKAVFDSRIPIISAVGHEVDITLCDFAADVRAATPTQAAQIAVPDLSQLMKQLNNVAQNLIRAIENIAADKTEQLDRLMLKPTWLDADNLLVDNREKYELVKEKMTLAMQNKLKELTKDFNLQLAKMDSLSPLKVMQRGYGIIKKEHTIINSVAKVELGNKIEIMLSDGVLQAKITNKETHDEKDEL